MPSFVVNVPVEVEIAEVPLFQAEGLWLVSNSELPELQGRGELRWTGDGTWSVKFQCDDEFPLDGIAHERSHAIKMVENHVRMVAANMREEHAG